MMTPQRISPLFRLCFAALLPLVTLTACDPEDTDIVDVDEEVSMRQIQVGVEFEEAPTEEEEIDVLITTTVPCEGSTLDIECGGHFEAGETCVIASKGSACALFTCNGGEAYLCHAEVLDGSSSCAYSGDLNDCKRRQ